jgi:hypothetical protein
MKLSRRAISLLVRPSAGATLLVALALGGSTPAAAHPPDFCGHRVVETKIGPMRLYFRTRGPVSCAAARSTIREYFRQPISSCVGSGCFIEFPSGWSCRTAPGAVTQKQGSVTSCERSGNEEQIATSRFRNRGFEFERTSSPMGLVADSALGETLLGCSAGTYPPSSDYRAHPRECIVYRGNREAHYTQIWMQRLRWRGWGARVAHARGRWHYCGMGYCPSGPLKARAYRPIYACGRYAYTRLRVHLVVRSYRDSTYLVHLQPC